MNQIPQQKIGLFLGNKSEISAAASIFSELQFLPITVNSFESLLKIESQLYLLLMDDTKAKKFFKKISAYVKGKGRDYFLPIIIVLRDEKNVLNWSNFEFFDVIVLPFDKLKLQCCLQRIKSVKFRLDYLKEVQLEQQKIKKAETELVYLAYHDVLTGLANRSLLEISLDKSILFANRANTKIAVLFLDLDHFKIVNDSLGHHKGDLLLKEVAKRLLYCIRKTDLVARQGGDEFVVVLNSIPNINMVKQIAKKIREVMEQSFIIDGQEIYISTSIGVSLYPEDGIDAHMLLKNADIAMYLAKECGRNTVQFCTPELTKRVLERADQENSLRLALKEDQLVLHYQPKLEIATGKITGLEALIRWRKPNGELVYPRDFITLAEETGLIAPITEWVIRRSFQESVEWKKLGLKNTNIAINLSMRNLKDENIVVILEKLLKSSGFNPHDVQFEITENLITHNVQNARSVLQSFKKMGVQLSIDDFGTGYSFLSYLKQFDVDELKIDKTFIDDITLDSNDAAIVTAIIAMAHSLKIKVVAEGVETLEQFEFLKKKDCDAIQGHFFCKALPLEELIIFLKNYRKTQ